MALDPDKLNLGIATACYLDMAEMVDTEKKLRKSLLEWVSVLTKIWIKFDSIKKIETVSVRLCTMGSS